MKRSPFLDILPRKNHSTYHDETALGGTIIAVHDNLVEVHLDGAPQDETVVVPGDGGLTAVGGRVRVPRDTSGRGIYATTLTVPDDAHLTATGTTGVEALKVREAFTELDTRLTQSAAALETADRERSKRLAEAEERIRQAAEGKVDLSRLTGTDLDQTVAGTLWGKIGSFVKVVANQIDVADLAASSAFVNRLLTNELFTKMVRALGIQLVNAAGDTVMNLTGEGDMSLAILNDRSLPVAQIGSNGDIIGASATVNRIVLDGQDLHTLLNERTRTVAHGYAQLPGYKLLRNNCGYVVVTANVIKGHRYRAKCQFPSFQVYQDTATLKGFLGIKYGRNISISSNVLAGEVEYGAPKLTYRTPPAYDFEFTAASDGELSMLLYGRMSGTAISDTRTNVTVWGTAGITLDDLGPELPNLAVATTAGGSWFDNTQTSAPAKREYVMTWNATGVKAFRQNGTTYSTDYAYQGYYLKQNGIMSSHWYFDYGAIRAALAGAQIVGCSIRLRNIHSALGSGVTAAIGWHGYGSDVGQPGTMTAVTTQHFARGQDMWVDLGATTGALFKQQAAGISVSGYGSTASQYYGYFAPDAQLSIRFIK